MKRSGRLRRTAPRVRTAVEFRNEVRLERLRSHRRGIPFCVLKVCLVGGSRSHSEMARLTRLVSFNIRATDEKGRLGRFILGVLLVDTPESGAATVMTRLSELAEKEQLEIRLEMRAYDVERFGDDDIDSQSGSGSREERVHVQLAGAGLGRSLRIDRPLSVGLSKRGHFHAFGKRSMDLVGSAVGLVFAIPIIAAAAVAIRMTSTGPAFFMQLREGRNGETFRIFKLRTMYNDAEAKQAELRKLSERDGPAFKMKHDPRVTPVGQFLRTSCIDELPQLLNVFLGHMSLVGPRPLPVSESRACAPWHRRRLDVRPGITCHWQINKSRVDSFDEWMRLDLSYVDRSNMWSDVKLLVKTISVPLAGRGSD
jgi:lipopolysaccharide/colanic/teichoic acid biosynthesis glycosyltransferase